NLASAHYNAAKPKEEGLVKVSDTASGKVRHTFKGYKSYVVNLTFSAEGRTLATSWDDSLNLWDLDKGLEADGFPDRPKGLTVLESTPQGKILAAGTSEGKVILWDLDKKKVLRRISALEQGVESLHFSRDGRLLAAGSERESPAVFDIKTGKLSGRI